MGYFSGSDNDSDDGGTKPNDGGTKPSAASSPGEGTDSLGFNKADQGAYPAEERAANIQKSENSSAYTAGDAEINKASGELQTPLAFENQSQAERHQPSLDEK